MIHVENVTKTFGTGTSALQDVTLDIDNGEFVFLVGPSGSGKTSLLRMLIRDMLPTSGRIVMNEVDIVKLPNSKIPTLRKKIGVVFQDLKLLTDRTIFENVFLPLQMAGESGKDATKKVDEILFQVGIAEHRDKFPIQLSGGELQRAAIARALVFSPEILLADEPTGNLDAATSWEIVKLLQDINKLGTTVIMATHNTDIINSLLKRVVTLDKGRLIRDEDKGGRKKTENEPVIASETKQADKEEEEIATSPSASHNDKEDQPEKDEKHAEKPEHKEQKKEKPTHDVKEKTKEKKLDDILAILEDDSSDMTVMEDKNGN